MYILWQWLHSIHVCVLNFDTFNMTNKHFKCNLMYWFEYFLFLSTPLTLDISLWGNWYYIHTTLQNSMQHGPLTPLTYPGSCKTCFFCIPGFGRKVSLIFPIIYLQVGLRSNLHICLFGLVKILVKFCTCRQLGYGGCNFVAIDM